MGSNQTQRASPCRYYAMTTNARQAEIVIYGDITSYPWLESDVSGYSLSQDLAGLDVDRINVHINSYGGDVSEGLTILNTLLRHPAEVVTYVDGFACSAASVVFMAGDRRIMAQSSNLLVHPAWCSTTGNAKSLRATAADLDTITEQSVTAYLARITKSREELLELMDTERFLGPEEAVTWGFATEIADLFESTVPTQSVRQLVYDRLHPSQEPQKPPVSPTHPTELQQFLAALR